MNLVSNWPNPVLESYPFHPGILPHGQNSSRNSLLFRVRCTTHGFPEAIDAMKDQGLLAG